MTKTITQMQPLIYDVMFSGAGRRSAARELRRNWTREALAIGAYLLGAWKISVDTGLAPWELHFWLIFAPLVALAELFQHSVRMLARTRAPGAR